MKRFLIVTFVLACGSKTQPPAAKAKEKIAPAQALAALQSKDIPPGLDIRLSNGKEGKPAFDHAKLAPKAKLSALQVNALLARATPLAAQASDAQDFALRPASQPPPRTGNVIKDTFPAPASTLLPPATSDPGKELRVLRYMPEGQVKLAPELTITFSQPMVPVTSQDDAAANLPVTLTPTPKGHWRWIGTRTILFDPDPRFPQATTYNVEVPSGTKSQTGGVLHKAVTFSFETPPISLVQHAPREHEPQRLDAPIFIELDQKIDVTAMAAAIKVLAPRTANSPPSKNDPWGSGIEGEPLAFHVLDAQEIAKHKDLAATVERAKKDEHEGRWLAIRTDNPMPRDSRITVVLPPGTPSAEGPNKTTVAQTFTFHTYAPMRIDELGCQRHGCTAGMPLTMRFNNPIDEDTFDDAMVTVSPALPDARIVAQGSWLYIYGATKARTTYKVTIASKIGDMFGQTLGTEETRSFPVGDAYPTFYGPDGVVLLDPASTKPTLDFFTTNYPQLKVKLFKVAPTDLAKYDRYVDEQWNHDRPPRPPGTNVFDQLVKTSVTKNELVETALDLQKGLNKAGFGHVVAVVEPYPWKDDYDPPRMIAWVQATKIAVDAHVDGDSLVAFASELASGAPAAGVELELRPYGVKGTTDAQGLATLPLADRIIADYDDDKPTYLVAKRGDDTMFVRESHGRYSRWYKRAETKALAWYVFDDRKLYKPGEEVHLKGWLRVLDQAKNGDIGEVQGVSSVSYAVIDSQGNQIGAGSAPVAALGSFDTKFTLPKTPNLGQTTVRFTASGPYTNAHHTHPLQTEEFRRPEFEVSTHTEGGPFVVGAGGDVVVDAKYYAGGPLPGANVNWTLNASPTTFTPPNRDDYTFGSWKPWWGYHRRQVTDDDPEQPRGQTSFPFEAKTDGTGQHILHVDVMSVKPAMPMTVSASASVTDLNRQQWSATTSFIVHPSTRYVGIKAARPFVDPGVPFDVDVIGVDTEGKAVPGTSIDVRVVRVEWEYKKGAYKTTEVDPQMCAVIAAKSAVPCHFQTPKGGTYELTATIVDPAGRPNQTTMTFWVSGGDVEPARDVAQEVVQIIPDKKEYTPGNTAELLVQAPFYPAEGVVTWRRSGIVKVERLTMTGPTASLKVPITDGMTPNIGVQVDLVGMTARTDDHGVPDANLPKRPAYAVGTLNLPVPPKHRTLAVAVTPNLPKLSPGETTSLSVEVKDAAGRPVSGAETTVVVVDESILALAGYTHPDPIEVLYKPRPDGTSDAYARAYVKLAKPKQPALDGEMNGGFGFGRSGFGPGGGGTGWGTIGTGRYGTIGHGSGTGSGYGVGGGRGGMRGRSAAPSASRADAKLAKAERKKDGDDRDISSGFDDHDAFGGLDQAGKPIAIRTNFNPLAAFSPSVMTGPDGKATVALKIPDNLTRYRIVAVAAWGKNQFGKGESEVTARLPLMVRPSPPRFLNYGDTFELPVTVQNQTDRTMTVKVAARATNARLTDAAGYEVSVPANDRVEVRFPAAAEMAGTARFQLVGAAGTASDAANVELPVWTPATTEAFATYGVLDEGAMAQSITLPGQVVKQFGGVDVTTASTNLQALTDAVLYLVHYKFECAEQRSSRMVAIAALRDVLAAFKTKDMPTAAQMEKSNDSDIEHLSQMQNYDGGFAFWDRGHPSEPYLSVYVTNALVRAKAKGFSVPQDILERARSYLANIERYYPWYYPPQVRWSISAYALYTRKLLGDLDIAKGQRLMKEAGALDKMTMETLGWLLSVFAGNDKAAAERAEIVRHALNHVTETAGAANFTTSYGDGNHLILASDRRVDGVMLEALILEQKDLDLIPKLVTGLLAHRKAGRWLNTQENAFVLLALDLYFRTYEKVTPDFVARVWLGPDYAGDHAFKGRTTETHQISIAMKDVAAHDKQDLTILKDGAGRLYYRIGMTYAPASLKIAPADYGFVVARRYEAVDNPKDVTRAPDGIWHIKAGARVRVTITMVNENRRYHVALVDPLPAGLEPMNPALATTGPIPVDPNEQSSRDRYWWWYGPWYEHQNMRDERVEAFAAMLWEGVHEYTYVARATTPGNFVVPPPKAEEMYMPETFGRGGSDRVIID